MWTCNVINFQHRDVLVCWSMCVLFSIFVPHHDICPAIMFSTFSFTAEECRASACRHGSASTGISSRGIPRWLLPWRLSPLSDAGACAHYTAFSPLQSACPRSVLRAGAILCQATALSPLLDAGSARHCCPQHGDLAELAGVQSTATSARRFRRALLSGRRSRKGGRPEAP